MEAMTGDAYIATRAAYVAARKRRIEAEELVRLYESEEQRLAHRLRNLERPDGA